MRRIFTDKIEGDTHKLVGEEHKHLSVVLRARTGDKVELCCGDGFVYLSEVRKIDKDTTMLAITDRCKDNSEPDIICDLFLGIIKGEHMEIAVQKCVELGIDSINPLVTDNTVKTDVNLVRLQKIALEAAKQCGRGKVPVVHPPQKIADTFDGLKRYDCVVFPYEKANAPNLKDFFSGASDKIGGMERATKIAVVIGPEGGFSDAEAQALGGITTPVTLGARILRADTACIAATTAVMLYFDQMKLN